MKRTILLAVLCMVCTIGLFAQKEKVVRIHKTDGTVVEYHAAAIRDFSFSGKAIVNDGDYTEITYIVLERYFGRTEINIDITATFSADDPYITGNSYGEDWGILYSTSPNVTIESGTLIKDGETIPNHIEFKGNLASGKTDIKWGESFSDRIPDEGYYADLEYNTTYYFRSYVRRPANSDIYEEEYFYSSEKSLSTGKPSMAYYGLGSIPAYASERGYVMPTEEAWATFDEQYPYFSLSDYKSTVINHWKEYLTPERIDAIKAQCATRYDCAEGMLYVADAVGEDFCQYLLDIYDREFVLDGASESVNDGEATYIECDASWNVPGNGYWRYAPANLNSKVNPSVRILLPEYMLTNYYYTIELTLAPNTDEAETLPSKVTARLLHEGAVASVLAQDQSTETDKCTVLVADSIEAERLGEGVLEISSAIVYGNRLNPKDNGKFLPVLRIAQIKVTPHKKEETAE